MTGTTTTGWRPMRAGDLDDVLAIADAVHGAAYSESRETFAERLALYPAGCQILDRDGAALGYLITHPWCRDTPPALGQRLGAIPADADTYYLHDIALRPETRGSGAGAAAVAHVETCARAAGFDEITLVAVGGADSYWERHGFTKLIAYPAYGPECWLMRRTAI
ncbi:MAG: GNAT family N-acetyltransferase [Sphingopyxis sp.]|uniref:GNAT family N-acetyltransferase n=1 Tax=Sphingopyxis sp. TaxID=1908224 RepID=UPI002AB9338F|nr:GNAT family N-acetyltransferase [Sphingopyxis sp.]MDZ3830271.1 GNAT family N-acetyltransferase [Sphingopyxis sp.]